MRRHESVARVVATACAPLAGDVRVDVYCKPKMKMRKERLFHFWFNTYFVTAGVGAANVPAPIDSQSHRLLTNTIVSLIINKSFKCMCDMCDDRLSRETDTLIFIIAKWSKKP